MKTTELKAPEFKKLLATYETELSDSDKGALYGYQHVSNTREFLSFMEQKEVNRIVDIDQHLIDAYVDYLKDERKNLKTGKPLDEQTISKFKGSITSFWKFLKAEDVKTCDITVPHKNINQQKIPTTLTKEEIEWLYNITDESAIGYRDRAMLSIYYGTGMRKSEGHRLCISDIDFGRNQIHVRKTKNSRERYARMSPTVKKHLEEYIYSYRDFYLHEQSTYDELFIGERGKPIELGTIAKRIEALWKRVQDKYGSEKEVSCHDLRHTLGTHLYLAGIKVEMVALMLGHRTLEATQLYIHCANELKLKS